MKLALVRRSAMAAALCLCAWVGSPRCATAGDGVAATAGDSGLQATLQTLAQRAQPGALGIAVLDLDSGKTWRVNADQAFPMMSVFKSAVGAAMLDRIEHGQNSFDQTLVVKREDLEGGIIRKQFQGTQETFTVRQLMSDMVSESDNTAADTLIKFMGGPAIVESYLRAHGIEGLHVDRYESGNTQLFEALHTGETPPADETDAQQDQRYLRGYHAFLADPGNRSTPAAAVQFLRKLWRHELLSKASSQYLLDLMYAQTKPNRLRAGLPNGVRLADKCGTSPTIDGFTAAYNDIGIMTWPNGHAVIVAAFLTASHASDDARQAIFVDLAKSVAAALPPRAN